MNYSYKNLIIASIIIILGFIIFKIFNIEGLIIYILSLVISEILLQILVDKIRENFQWLITKKKDFLPQIDQHGLDKFIIHGFDTELGWVRKPNTEHEEIGKFGKTIWHTNEIGSRLNLDNEDLPRQISCYGDSFAFCRQVNDNETWEYYLSKLTKTNVINWGVGNYGMDQALIRLTREYPKYPTKIVILGVVPDTISRILSTWKHFYEYGNTFAFKPRFKLENNNLILIKNLMDQKEKFNQLNIFIDDIKKNDFFYENKFKDELITFPYLISVFKNPLKNIPLIYWNVAIIICNKLKKDPQKFNLLTHKKIMKINLLWRIKLYKNKQVVNLMISIIKEFMKYSEEKGVKFIFLLLPQKDDVLFVKNNYHFYNNLKHELKNDVLVIDILEEFVKLENLDEFYSDNTEYGGHYSKFGNEFIAKKIYHVLKDEKYL